MEPDEFYDVKLVKDGSALVHVEDAGAPEAFNAGKAIFDVTTHATKLEAFIQKHGLQQLVARSESGNLPAINALVNNRPIYLAYKK